MRPISPLWVGGTYTRGLIAAALLLVGLCPLGLTQEIKGDLEGTSSQVPTPEWAQDLVIYEIAPKTFTSPSGVESGTFASLQGRLPYLKRLGITAIWLSGYAHSDPHHFFNIWMGYATIEPDKLDPTLGTPEEFQALIDGAHSLGIRVIVDVTTHGVMPDSPLVTRHPQWFRGGTWGMTDYDWSGGHTDLDNWWVETWTNYVTRYGVDGFRLDVDIYRPDLWARIRQNAAAAGHPVVIFEEVNSAIPGVTDFSEDENVVSAPTTMAAAQELLRSDVAGFYDRRFGKSGTYDVQIQYFDGTKTRGDSGGNGQLHVHLDGLSSDKASRRIGDRTRGDGLPDVQLTVDSVSRSPIANIEVRDDRGERWSLGAVNGEPPAPVEGDPQALTEPPDVGLPDNASLWSNRFLQKEGTPPTLRLYVPTLSYGSSVLLSEHGYSAYQAKGSRADFGYSFLFTPMIPIFMAGEEFDAGLHDIPWESPSLLGGSHPGQGSPIYGSMLDWSEVTQKTHREMLYDVQTMLAIRAQEHSILLPVVKGNIKPRLMAVPYASDIDVPVPYMRWDESAAIIVLANRNTHKDAHLSLQIPLTMFERRSHNYEVTDLWNRGRPHIYSARDLSHFICKVRRDKAAHGGLAIYKVEVRD
jgi:hypothetical protein